MASPLNIRNLSDVASAAASRARQAAAKPDVQFVNISLDSLAHLPGLKSRFVDVLNAVEDFRAAYETALRKAGMVPEGHHVGFTKSKRGWLVVVGPARAATVGGPAIGDVE